ncbi:anti-sigma-I factor RsgI6-like [Gigantopelta aegis]|uniref:anti-sigma-I factor RsgI6-like n=1 Tax=Gigantopelta aegis TaxID=1735272 RepID=UPI001B88812C|nr:anti-sigma-I factor RsgI6-like [Gigantopelta aegis]
MLLVLLFLSLVPGSLSQELIQNGGMESMTGWTCPRGTCSLTNTSHGESYAIKVGGRESWKNGLTQTVTTTQPDTSYTFSAWVHVVSDIPGKLGQLFRVSVYHTFQDGTRKTQHVAINRLIRFEDGWVELRGDFTMPNNDVTSSRVVIYGPPIEAEYLVDDASMTPIADWPNWLQDTEASIKNLRTSPININVSVAGNIDTADVEIKITQLKKSYPFGTAIGCDLYHHGDVRYQDFIHAHFNWAVTENSLKWKLMEKRKGRINYRRPLNALKKLKSNGIKVRGHNILWATTPGTPTWIRNLKGDALKAVVNTRIAGVVTKTKDYLEHWDVNNENLHGHFFEWAVQDASYNLEIFNISHQTAPNVKMFLNDYAVVSRVHSTGAYLTQALQFKAANVGLYGIGAQCHFNGGVVPDLNVIKSRLDTLAEAGVPIWITEFSVQNTNETIRADMYENLLRLFYAHPAVEGIMFWGFWSEKHFQQDTASLVSGKEFRLNAAGQRVLDLFENQWMTKETHTLSQSGNQFTVDGFHGDYEVSVMYQGQELVDKKTAFMLGSSPHTVTLSVA